MKDKLALMQQKKKGRHDISMKKNSEKKGTIAIVFLLR